MQIQGRSDPEVAHVGCFQEFIPLSIPATYANRWRLPNQPTMRFWAGPTIPEPSLFTLSTPTPFDRHHESTGNSSILIEILISNMWSLWNDHFNTSTGRAITLAVAGTLAQCDSISARAIHITLLIKPAVVHTAITDRKCNVTYFQSVTRNENRKLWLQSK